MFTALAANRFCAKCPKSLFENPFENPIIVLQDISFKALSIIISFIYNGEVSVTEDYFPTLMKTAECLRIKGLSCTEDAVEDHTNENQTEVVDMSKKSMDTSAVKEELLSDEENCSMSKVDSILNENMPKSEPIEIDNLDKMEKAIDENTVCKNSSLRKKYMQNNVKKMCKSKYNVLKEKRIAKSKIKVKCSVKTDKENQNCSDIVNKEEVINKDNDAALLNLTEDIQSLLHNKNFISAVAHIYDKDDTCCLNAGIDGDLRPNFPCPFCKRIYHSWGYRRRHVKMQHESNSLNCKWCSTKLDSETLWFQHVVNNHDISSSQARDSLIIMVEAHTVFGSSPPSPDALLHHLQLDSVSVDNSLDDQVCTFDTSD